MIYIVSEYASQGEIFGIKKNNYLDEINFNVFLFKQIISQSTVD